MKLSAMQTLPDLSTKFQGIRLKTKPVANLLLFGVILSMLFASISPLAALAQSEPKQVLYINSYHVGYKFSDDITRALVETLGVDDNIELRVEYLDTKRVSNDDYFQLIYQLYAHKYQDTDLDLIVSSDDAALNFLFEYADSLFPDVPVVFVGANYFDDARLVGYDRFTGISEEADIPGTIETALSIHPGVDHMVIVNDTTVTGQNVLTAIEKVIPTYPDIDFEILGDASMAEIQDQLRSLEDNSLVLLTIFSRDNEENFFEYNQFSTLIAESSAVPVYATWDFSLGFGVVGGKLISGYTEGQRAAQLALRVLNGENPANIPVDYTIQSQPLFDYNVMERFDITLSALPDDSFVLDRPVSFFEANLNAIIGSSVGFIILIGIIIFLVYNNNQRRQAQEELSVRNQELQAVQRTLEEEVASRTRALETSTEVSRRLSTILDPDQLVIEVVEQLTSAFNYYHAHIYLYDQARQNLVMAGGTGDAGRAMLASGHKIETGRGLVGRAAANNEIVLIPDVAQAEGWLPNPLLPDTKAEVAVPIAIGENVLGVLDVQHNITDGLTDEDASLIQAIANQVAVAVQNAQEYSRTQQQARRETQIAEISQRIQTAGTIEDVLKVAVRELGQVLNAERADVELSMVHQSNSESSAS